MCSSLFRMRFTQISQYIVEVPYRLGLRIKSEQIYGISNIVFFFILLGFVLLFPLPSVIQHSFSPLLLPSCTSLNINPKNLLLNPIHAHTLEEIWILTSVSCRGINRLTGISVKSTEETVDSVVGGMLVGLRPVGFQSPFCWIHCLLFWVRFFSARHFY